MRDEPASLECSVDYIASHLITPRIFLAGCALIAKSIDASLAAQAEGYTPANVIHRDSVKWADDMLQQLEAE